jgi:hypothetical protein
VSEQTSPPRETLIRAVTPGIEFRAAGDAEDDLGPGISGCSVSGSAR